ncbi:hypothetical protein VTO42DRAFT_1854 [Malbranchea cinnamomea]
MANTFYQYPEPLEGPQVPYKNAPESNPALRGTLLQIGGSLVASSNLLQSFLFRNAGFPQIRTVKHLDDYEPRYDPTVFPVIRESPDKPSASSLPAPQKRRGGQGGYYTSADYHALYKSGELTPTAVVEALLPLIRRDTSPAGEHSVAFIDSKVDIIRAAAAASTERYKNGTPLGPLDGVPIAVKDEVDLEGYKRTVGSKLDFTGKTNQTSWCVKKWEEAGAVIIGKTTMHELGLDTSNNNPNFGTPRNPHNPDYYTGGSSGGSGYVLAAGIVPIALGADGGGSIRIPSSFCGVYGLKTSHGRISGNPTVGLAGTTGVFGPMAASLDDLALAYRIMAAPDPTNAHSRGFPDPLSTINVSSRPRVIGVYRDWINRSDPPVISLFDKAIEHYKNQSYTVVDISIPYLPEGQKAHALTILCEIASGVTKEQICQVTPANKVLLSLGANQASGQDFLAAQKLRNLLMRHLAYLFQRYPGLVIATPTVPIAGWKIANGEADLTHGVSDANTSLRTMEYVYLANFTGCPAITFPMGYAEGTQMPVGLMGMGEWGSEEALIEWARDGEGVLDVDVEVSTSATDANNHGDGAAVFLRNGLRIPSGKHGKWVDAIGLARAQNSQG